MMSVVRATTVAISSFAAAFALAASAEAQQVDYDHWAFDKVAVEEETGRIHVDGAVDYGGDFPTSGDHSATPAQPGFYDDEVNPEALVHNLEHGNIVVYYDEPGEQGLAWIKRWTDGYQGALDGVVAVRKPGLGERVVLTAWENRLELETLDSRGAYFVDAFRGRGPERAVR